MHDCGLSVLADVATDVATNVATNVATDVATERSRLFCHLKPPFCFLSCVPLARSHGSAVFAKTDKSKS